MTKTLSRTEIQGISDGTIAMDVDEDEDHHGVKVPKEFSYKCLDVSLVVDALEIWWDRRTIIVLEDYDPLVEYLEAIHGPSDSVKRHFVLTGQPGIGA